MLPINEVTDIFYLSGEFYKGFDTVFKKRQIEEECNRKRRNKPNRRSDSEVMTILIAFHLSGMRNLKYYYLFYVSKHMMKEFPFLVSYTRFVELQHSVLLCL